MNAFTNILAEGFSPGMIFAIFVVILIAFANMMAKKKQTDATVQELKQQREARARGANNPRRPPQIPLEQIRREILQAAEQQALRERMAAGIAAQDRERSKQKKKKVKPPPMPMPVEPHAAREAKPEPVVLSPSATRPGNEAARNVRLMLQPAGIREAFILSEVLGKPKALRND